MDAHQPVLGVAVAAAQSSLPSHLIAQIDGYLARLGPFDCVFVHGDLIANHVFVEHSRLTGIIDLGDAMPRPVTATKQPGGGSAGGFAPDAGPVARSG